MTVKNSYFVLDVLPIDPPGSTFMERIHGSPTISLSASATKPKMIVEAGHLWMTLFGKYLLESLLEV